MRSVAPSGLFAFKFGTEITCWDKGRLRNFELNNVDGCWCEVTIYQVHEEVRPGDDENIQKDRVFVSLTYAFPRQKCHLTVACLWKLYFVTYEIAEKNVDGKVLAGITSVFALREVQRKLWVFSETCL